MSLEVEDRTAKNQFVALNLQGVAESIPGKELPINLRVSFDYVARGKYRIGLQQGRVDGVLTGCEMQEVELSARTIERTVEVVSTTESRRENKAKALVEGAGLMSLGLEEARSGGDRQETKSRQTHLHHVAQVFATGAKPAWSFSPGPEQDLLKGTHELPMKIKATDSEISGVISADVSESLHVIDVSGAKLNIFARLAQNLYARKRLNTCHVKLTFKASLEITQ